MNLTEEQLLALAAQKITQSKLYGITLYPWQQKFCNAGKNDDERMLMAGNRVGKTFTAATETAYHAIGYYPDWWKGFKIEKRDCLIWVSSLTNETGRDITQLELLGPVGQWGTGLIPADCITRIKTRQAGIPDVVDTIEVRRRNGGTCIIKTKVAEQGWKKYQGTAPDFIWQDEEPDDFKVFTECETRILSSKGRIAITFTPLMGETLLVQHFLEGSKRGQGMSIHTATWDDAPHLDQKAKDRQLSRYSEHERATRTQGIPMMGEGAVFPIPDEKITCDPFQIPDHWARIAGHDFGMDHPAAGSWLAVDRDTDTVYMYDEYSESNQLPVYHSAIYKKKGDWIPVAWPHDGINRDKGGSGEPLKNQYDCKFLSMSARYKNDKGGSQAVEPIVMDMYERMTTDRFKVFRNCQGFLQEKRGLHRKNGKIRAVKDDIFKATCYALMMLRYATPKYLKTQSKAPMRPIF